MRMPKYASGRAFTLVEMLVSMAVMGIVMSFAALEFKDVVFTYLNADSHLSAEQQARVAVAKVNDLSHQASVVDGANPAPPITEPGPTPGPELRFTMAQSLDPNSIPLQNGVPAPCYDVVTVSLAPDSAAPDPIAAPHNLVEQVEPYQTSRTECTKGVTFGLHLIARNVENFTVQQIEPCNGIDCTPYGQGYRIDISIFGYDENKVDRHAGALYHLSSVITPLTFGASQ